MARHGQDPVTAFLICIIAATTLLRPSVAAPVNSFSDSWWYNACGHHGVHHPTRHSKHNNNCSNMKDIVPHNNKIHVRQQMKICIGTVKEELKNIKSTYSEVMEAFRTYPEPSMDWLPKFKNPAKRSNVVLRYFHADLQKYIVAVNYLSTLSVQTDAKFDWEKRKSLLTKLLNQMKGLLCEIETAVNATCQTVPQRVPASFPEDHGLNKQLHDITSLYFVDWGVLKRFINYMKEGQRKFLSLNAHRDWDSSDDDDSEAENATFSAEAAGE